MLYFKRLKFWNFTAMVTLNFILVTTGAVFWLMLLQPHRFVLLPLLYYQFQKIKIYDFGVDSNVITFNQILSNGSTDMTTPVCIPVLWIKFAKSSRMTQYVCSFWTIENYWLKACCVLERDAMLSGKFINISEKCAACICMESKSKPSNQPAVSKLYFFLQNSGELLPE
jgi:hypothetical protein